MLIIIGFFGFFCLLFYFTFRYTPYSCGYETQNKEEFGNAFKDYFGFKPPKSLNNEQLKVWALRDTYVIWLKFCYNSNLLEKIKSQDKSLKIAKNNSSNFQDIIVDLKKDVHHPYWVKLPNKNVDEIYYKEDFLDHTYSVYYLWTDKQTKLTFLYVEYFD